MAGKIRIKAEEKAGTVTVKALIKHPMETGRRKDKNGNLVPSHHITCLLYTSPSPRDPKTTRMPSSA